MSNKLQALILAAATALPFDGSLAGQDVASAPAQPAPLPIFQPKNLGAPKIRVGGGTRGADLSEPALYVLSPEQPGLTTQEQPVLYWFVSRPVEKPIEITVTDKQSVLLKTRLDGVATVGIQSVSLAGQGVRLKPGTKYRWSVAIVNNPKQRSGDIFASGGIGLVPETEALKAKLTAAANDKERAFAYAEEGIWYDSLAALQRWADLAPGEAATLRNGLLKQVGLEGLGQ